MVDSGPHAGGGEEEGPMTPSVRTSWHDGDSASMTVVDAVARATGTEVTTLPPLQDTVDVDALDAVLDGNHRESADRIQVSFAYAGVDVLVDSSGFVEVWRGDG